MSRQRDNSSGLPLFELLKGLERAAQPFSDLLSVRPEMN